MDISATDRKKLLHAISVGMSRRIAAELIGRCHQAVAQLAERDVDFDNALRRAESFCMLHHLQVIHNRESNWQASAWLLERKWRMEFGRKHKGDLLPSMESSTEMHSHLEEMSDEELQRMAEIKSGVATSGQTDLGKAQTP